jgi:multiple sugar transport system permease protein
VKEQFHLTTLASPPAGHQTLGRLRGRSRWTGRGFVSPFMTVLALVLLALTGFWRYLSLFQAQLVGGTSFVGFDNYAMGQAAPARRR